jgi:predicted transcriptional regulator
LTTSLVENINSQKKTWIVTEKGVPTGIIPFNRVQDISKLENIQVFEVAFPINYTFKLDQTLKEVWKVFSVTGDSILPVMNKEKHIVGTLEHCLSLAFLSQKKNILKLQMRKSTKKWRVLETS